MWQALLVVGVVVAVFKAAKDRRDARGPVAKWFKYDPPCSFVMLNRAGMLEWARWRGEQPATAADTLGAIRRDIEGTCPRTAILAATKDPQQRRNLYDLELAAVRSYFETTHVLMASLQFVAELRRDFADAGVDVSGWPDLYGAV